MSAFQKTSEFWQQFKKNKAAEISLYMTVIFILLAVFAPWVSPYDPFALGTESFLPPQRGHWMGTDDLGRDSMSRVFYGTRVSLAVGILAAGTSLVIGMLIGSCAGYFGGFSDNLLMRLAEYFLVIPRFFLALLIIAMFGTGIGKIIVIIGVLGWPEIARVVRAQFLTLKEREFVLAARAMGQSNRSIIFSEILPNAIPPAIVVGSFLVARAILLEAGLSFLGLGDPTVVSWGSLLRDAQDQMRTSPWMVVFPGVALSLMVLALNLFGDGINDVLNPKLKEK
jgi:peptide/nickel transport system permease protein